MSDSDAGAFRRDVSPTVPWRALALALLLLVGGVAWAHASVSVSGTVLDVAGESLGGAKLTLSGAAGDTRATESDATGRFAFEDLAPGQYVLRVEASIHLPLEMPLDLTAQPPAPLKIRMKVGITEEVSVLGLAPEEDRTAAANNADALGFDDDLIQGLPTLGDSTALLGLISNFLAPAAQGTEGTSILVDGADSSDLMVPSSAVRRINVNRDPYSAEYRRPGKGRIEVVTQDGSRRRYKGGLALKWHTSAFDAKNALSATKQDADERVLQLSLNGPLWGRAGAPRTASFFLGLEYRSSVVDQIVNAETLSGPVQTHVPAADRLAKALARLDLRAGLHRFSLRYGRATGSSTQQNVGGLHLPEQGYDSDHGPDQEVQAAATLFFSGYMNDARLTLNARNRRAGRQAHGPALDVNGAFLGGEPQVNSVGDRRRFEFRNVGTLVAGPHTFRLGGGFRHDAHDGTDARNFGGVFEFASLDAFALEMPFVYRENRGVPRWSLALWEAEAFVQDEIRVGSDLRLTAGLRYDRESEIDDSNNVAPRLALAYSPGSHRTVYRAGLGVFYERLSSDVSQRRLLYDGERLRSVVITNPSYPDPFVVGEPGFVPPSLFRTAADLETPHLIQASAAWERQVARWASVAIDYSFLRGRHLLRLRDVNAPLPGTGLRPDPSLQNVLEIGSDGTMSGHALTFSYRGRIGRHVKATALYTFARTLNDVPGSGSSEALPFRVPADNNDPDAEYGRADFDRRHRLTFAGIAKLPHEIEIGATLRAMSGAPYDITTGNDDNGDSYAQDRPPGVGRNTGGGPGFAQLDLRLTKMISAASPFRGEKKRRGQIRLSVDAFNVLNHVNYGPYVGAMTSSFFGQAVIAKDPRMVQLSLSYGF